MNRSHFCHETENLLTIKFYLKYKDRESLLSMRYRHNNIVYQYSTGERVHPDDWDDQRHRLKDRKSNHVSNQTNRYLERLESAMRETHANLLAKENLTKKYLEEEFLKKIGAVAPDSEYLIDFIDHFIEERKKSGQYEEATLTNYENVRNKLWAYESERRKHFTFSEIDMEFYYGFMDHLAQFKFKKNYLNKIIRTIKVFMNDAFDREYHTSLKHKRRGFTVQKEEVFNVYLTDEEVLKIYQLDLTGTPGMDRTRDLFVIACYTGLRYGDISNLKDENFQDGKLHVTMAKGGKKHRLVIPCSPIVRMIFFKYHELPKANANQVMNRQIKDICELAEIDTPTIKDGKTFKKFKLVSTHTARRSFATNSYKAGVPPMLIRSITGHRTEQNFMKYIKITPEEHADIAAKNPFFTQMKIS